MNPSGSSHIVQRRYAFVASPSPRLLHEEGHRTKREEDLTRATVIGQILQIGVSATSSKREAPESPFCRVLDRTRDASKVH